MDCKDSLGDWAPRVAVRGTISSKPPATSAQPAKIS